MYAQAEPFRDSLRSANSASVYSTDSTSSPLDSIIRDYPVVPGAPSNAFQFSPNSYTSRTPTSNKQQQQQQQYPQHGAPTRLRELSPQANVPDTQAHERSGSSPLLHTRFRSPTDSVSVDPHRPDSAQANAPPTGNFIDLRDSGAYEAVDDPKVPQDRSYGYAHGIPPRSGHGVNPILQFNNGSLAPVYGQQPASRFSPITPETEADADFPNSNRVAYGQSPNNGLAVTRDDYGEWRLYSSFFGDTFRISAARIALPWQSL